MTRLLIKLVIALVLLVLPVTSISYSADGTPIVSKYAPAVVRIKSHGCSGEVIYTRQNYSLIVSCAHAFETQRDLQRRIVIDGYPLPQGVTGVGPAKLLRVDYNRDLSLIEIELGPLWSLTVAPSGYQPGGQLQSIGYDSMQWPATQRSATWIPNPRFAPTGRYMTVEQPWPGRSGGALIDPQTGYLVGVTEAYETTGARRGMYVNLETIREFLYGETNTRGTNRGIEQNRQDFEKPKPDVREYFGNAPTYPQYPSEGQFQSTPIQPAVPIQPRYYYPAPRSSSPYCLPGGS